MNEIKKIQSELFFSDKLSVSEKKNIMYTVISVKNAYCMDNEYFFYLTFTWTI